MPPAKVAKTVSAAREAHREEDETVLSHVEAAFLAEATTGHWHLN
jgi:hypothetical protein